jgi:preprotein translocase subunit SecG
MSNFLIGFLTVVHMIAALFLILLILMQKSHEQGVGAAFGGGIADTMLGGSVTPLVKMTIYCAVAILITTVTLGFLNSKRTTGTSIMAPGSSATAPATTEGDAALPAVGTTNAPAVVEPTSTTAAPAAPATEVPAVATPTAPTTGTTPPPRN